MPTALLGPVLPMWTESKGQKELKVKDSINFLMVLLAILPLQNTVLLDNVQSLKTKYCPEQKILILNANVLER